MAGQGGKIGDGPSGEDAAAGLPAQAEAPRGFSAIVQRNWRHTELKFAGSVVQSRMHTFRPGRLLVPYTRTMMASVLLQPRAEMIGMVGLGGGSQAKFCHRYLPGARLEVVENNPEVVALRRRFRVPDDDGRLQVFLDDGARFIRQRRGRYDLLLVDAFDPSGIPPALSTRGWYDDCRDALAPGGVMATNLYCDDAGPHLEKLRRSFGDARVLALQEPEMSNLVAFAWRGDPAPGEVFDPVPRLAELPRALRRELAPELSRLAGALRER